MWGALGWETLNALGHNFAPLFCSACPWVLILVLLLLACAAGACVGCLLTLVATSCNCRRFLWFGFYGFLGGLTPAAGNQAPTRRRLREYLD